MSILCPMRNRIVPAMLAAAMACGAAACVGGVTKTPAERQADREMVERVQLALNSDKVLYARHITVRADSANGVVTLGGYVWSTEELNEARDDAQAVSGVTKVVDRMEVDRGEESDSAVSH